MPIDQTIVLLAIRKKRLPDEETTHDKENVNPMGKRNLGEKIKEGILKIMLSMPMCHAKDGESPQQVQTEDALAVHIDAQETLHLFDCFGNKDFAFCMNYKQISTR